MDIRNFRDLRVWQAAMNLVEDAYRLCRSFPRGEAYGLTQQIQRSAVSIPSNIAEGHTRKHRKEFLHHLSIAHASLAELETQLEIACRVEYLSAAQLASVLDKSAALGRQLSALRNALIGRSHFRSPTPNPQPPTPGPGTVRTSD